MAFFLSPKLHAHERGRCDSGIYEFYNTVDIATDGDITLRIFASTRYVLFVNGKYVCEGPARSSEFLRYYDTVKTDAFKKGKNEMLFRVAHITEPVSFTSGYKSQKPALIFDAKGEKDFFFSDISFKCRYIENFKFVGDDTFVFPFEKVCGDKVYKDIPLEQLQDAFSVDFDRGYKTHFGICPYRLEKRPIPMIYPSDVISFKEVRRGTDFVEYDAGVYVTARPEFVFEKGCSAKIIYSECYRDKDGVKTDRAKAEGYIPEEHAVDVVTTGENDFTYSPFWFRAFRFIRIETKTPEKILGISAKKFHYPADIKGSFCCSDDYFNRMVTVSENTMLSCTTDLFVDCPYYEQQQYIMDSAVEAAVFLRMTGDTSMVKKCIYEFAASQNPNGLLAANYPQSWMVQIIPGFSFFFIWLLDDYLNYSADTAFVKQFIPTVDGILSYFDENLNENGLVMPSVEWDFVDWVPGWEKGTLPLNEGEPNGIYTLYLAYGLLTASRLAKKCGRTGLSEEYSERYETLKKNINKHLYDEKKGLYRDGGNTFSMHGIIWATLSEIVKDDEACRMIERLSDPEIFKSSYSMNFFLFRAFEKCGVYEKAAPFFDGWRRMLDMNCTVWCENPDSPRSECHGWSSAPLYEFSANILGVKYSDENVIVIKPEIFGLSYAKGCVPTRFGNVFVEWKNTKDGFSLKVNSPKGIAKKLILPSGTTVLSCDGEIII